MTNGTDNNSNNGSGNNDGTDNNANNGSGNSNGTNQGTPTDINALIVKLPTLWASNPRTWFIQAESQFSLGKITADVSKYNYVVATLPQEIAESVSDILENPPNADLYANLKKSLIDRHSLSLESRIKKLVSDEEVGDRKPSEFFRTLQRLAGNCGTVGEALLKELWMSKLPQTINVALIPQRDGDLTALLKLADQVWEAIQTANISAVNSQGHSGQCSSTSHSELRGEINELKLMIEKLSFDRSRNRDRSSSRNRSTPRSSSNSRDRSRSRRSYSPGGRWCSYHFRFGNNANKCVQPCSFVNRTQSSSSSSFNANNPN